MKKSALICAGITALFLAASPARAVHTKAGPFQKVMVIVFENSDYKDALDQTYFAKFAKSGVLLTDHHAVTHPSQGNYIALIAGDQLGVDSDDDINLNASHIGDLLEAKGKTWRVYAEAYPGNCFLKSFSRPYARKHNPFISFADVQHNPDRCRNIVNASKLKDDVQNGTLADYSFYVPDLNNDGHDTGVIFADKWFSRTFSPLLQNPSFMSGMLIVATFDEGERDATNHIYTALVGAGITPGSTYTKPSNHYSLLRLIEDGFGLGTLGRKDSEAATIDIF